MHRTRVNNIIFILFFSGDYVLRSLSGFFDFVFFNSTRRGFYSARTSLCDASDNRVANVTSCGTTRVRDVRGRRYNMTRNNGCPYTLAIYSSARSEETKSKTVRAGLIYIYLSRAGCTRTYSAWTWKKKLKRSLSNNVGGVFRFVDNSANNMVNVLTDTILFFFFMVTGTPKPVYKSYRNRYAF